MALLLLFLLPAIAAPESAFADSRFDVWTTDDGLPQNSVYSITQTRDGYIWFTTFGGLVRFDGMRFKVFDRVNAPDLPTSRFTALYEDASGALWAGTEKNGIVRYSDGRFTSYTTAGGLPSNKVRAVGGGSDGSVWVYTDGGIAGWDGERFSTPDGGSQADVINAILPMRERNTGFTYYDSGGLHRYVDGRLRTYDADDGLPPGARLSSLYEDQRTTLWVETEDRSLYRLEGDKLTASPVKGYAPEGAAEMTVAYEDRRGDIWVATRNGPLCRWRNGELRTYTTRDGLSSDQVETVFEDQEGNLWFGTYNNGLNRLREELFTVYSRPQGLSNPNVYPILEDQAGDVLVGTWGGGVNRLRDGRFTQVGLGSHPAGVDEKIIGALYQDADGSLWVGTFDSSIIHLRDGRATRYSTRDGVTDNDVRAIYRDRRGDLWIGTTNGLLLFRDGRFSAYRTEQGLPHPEVNAIIEDHSGGLWIGTLGGLARFQNGRFVTYTEREGLLSNNIRALYEDDDQVLWVGSYDGGLNRFKDGRFTSYTIRDGLFDNSVFQILEDGRGNFWMSCNRGIYRVSRAELNQFAEGRRPSVTSIYYGKRDGLLNTECNGGVQPAGLRSRDGRLWFPTQDGVAVVNPELVQRSADPPPVALEEFTIGGRDLIFRGAAEIPAGEEQFSIHYTGLSFINPEQVKFRYKLEGLDTDWVDAGSRRTAYYSHVPPGTYTFRVIAANSDGLWNMEGAVVRVTILPRFYRTWWFTTLVLAGILIAAVFAYRRRVARLERGRAEQEAFARALIASQEGERQRIAAELHDSLGQNLLVIKNRALMALGAAGDTPRAMRQVGEISTTAAQAIDEVREIAYNLHPYQLDRLGLTNAIEAMVRKVEDASGVMFSVALDSLDGLFTKEDEINLFRIIQECVNNVVKHSGATVASLAARVSGRALRVEITDEGRGFTPEALRPPMQSDGRGLGLRGLAERVKILGGTYTLTSAPGRGTTFVFLFTLRDAQNGNRDKGSDRR